MGSSHEDPHCALTSFLATDRIGRILQDHRSSIVVSSRSRETVFLLSTPEYRQRCKSTQPRVESLARGFCFLTLVGRTYTIYIYKLALSALHPDGCPPYLPRQKPMNVIRLFAAHTGATPFLVTHWWHQLVTLHSITPWPNHLEQLLNSACRDASRVAGELEWVALALSQIETAVNLSKQLSLDRFH